MQFRRKQLCTYSLQFGKMEKLGEIWKNLHRHNEDIHQNHPHLNQVWGFLDRLDCILWMSKATIL